MLTIDDHSLHVWHWQPEGESPRPFVCEKTHLPWLTGRELERYKRLQLPDRKLWFLAGKVFVRQVLSHYLEREPGQWQFTENQYGKPAVVPGQLKTPLSFNLSHSGRRFLLAVSGQALTGADIEFSARQRRVAKLAHRYFSKAEANWLLALPEARQQESFYCLWTLKEAYIKARGMGLALALDSFSFDLGVSGVIDFHHHDPATALEHQWQFWRIRQPRGEKTGADDYHYALAIGTEGECPMVPENIVFRPGKAPQRLPCEILARS